MASPFVELCCGWNSNQGGTGRTGRNFRLWQDTRRNGPLGLAGTRNCGWMFCWWEHEANEGEREAHRRGWWVCQVAVDRWVRPPVVGGAAGRCRGRGFAARTATLHEAYDEQTTQAQREMAHRWNRAQQSTHLPVRAAAPTLMNRHRPTVLPIARRRHTRRADCYSVNGETDDAFAARGKDAMLTFFLEVPPYPYWREEHDTTLCKIRATRRL